MLLNRNNPHGGDIYKHGPVLDLSSNVNPFGIPEEVKKAAREAVERCVLYPDPRCARLREGLARKEGISEEEILCGNGAAELIYSFAFALPKDRPALAAAPAFSEYGSALAAAGIRTGYHILSEGKGFRFDEEILTEDLSRAGALFLCTPNNPTGVTVSPELLERILDTGVRVFADMCFLELSDDPGKYDLPGLIGRYRNLFVLKAFTKSFAVPGLRLGYVLSSDREFLGIMSEKAPCWNVSVPAQEAGAAALGCGAWLARTSSEIRRERERVAGELRSMGIRVCPGEANYLLLFSERDLYGELLARGILTRDCSNYTGLRKGYIRIAIRLPEENDRLLAAMKEVV